MPEEVNRVLTDQIADLLFTTEESANGTCAREGIGPDRIHFVGNVMIDSLTQAFAAAERSTILCDLGLAEGEPILVTLHRPSNVDHPATLGEVLRGLSRLAADRPVVFPVHPRTRDRIARLGGEPLPGLRLTEPLGYLDFLRLMSRAALVLTDSGGVQEETTFLGIPCLTMRPNTERPATLTDGTNRLVASRADAIVIAARESLDTRATNTRRPPLWDGKAAERIVAVFRARTPAREAR